MDREKTVKYKSKKFAVRNGTTAKISDRPISYYGAGKKHDEN